MIFELVGLINGYNFIEYYFGMEKKMNEKSSPASRLLKRWVVIFLVGGHFSSTQKDVLISP